MINKSKEILLWGIKILAERYWGEDFNPDIDKGRLEKTMALMPGSETLMSQYENGYQTEGNMYALKSIFSQVKLFKDRELDPEHPDNPKLFLQPVFDFNELNLPVDNPIIEQYFFAGEPVNFEQYSLDSDAEKLLNFLQKYGGFLPIFNEPDCAMPLFDYVKIAAALAADPERDYRLVVGDLSGIQDFIYTISSENALKVLRARSFYLELLIKTVAYEICDNLKLTSANIFYAGGGNFLLLLPELDNLDENLGKYYNAINSHFINHFQGNLHIPFATVKLTREELKNTSDDIIKQKWNELFEKELSKAKNQKYHTHFNTTKNESLIAKMGNPEEVDGKKCPFCHDDTYGISDLLKDVEGIKLCPFCTKLREIGTQMHKQDKIAVSRFPDKEFSSASLPNPKLWPFADKNEKEVRVFTINTIELTENPSLFYCNYIYTKKDGNGKQTTAEFKDMADDGFGAARIATLAMDVDNMSTIFKDGIRVNDDQREFLIYAPTLSRMLDYFFKIGLNQLCEKPKYRVLQKSGIKLPNTPRQLSVIYSGGDDLLLAGAWNDVAELAIDIQKNFQHFTCGNTDMGISGGLYLSNHSFPFYVSVSKAKQAENEFAKKNYEFIKANNKDSYLNHRLFIEETGQIKKKNSMVFFFDELTGFTAKSLAKQSAAEKEQTDSSETECPDRNKDTVQAHYLVAAKWNEVYEFIIKGLEAFLDSELVEEFENNKLSLKYSKGFIGKLYEMHDKYLHNKEGRIYIPDLVYHFSRIEKDLRYKLFPIFMRYINYHHKQLDNPIRYLPVVLNWLELLTREKGEK